MYSDKRYIFRGWISDTFSIERDRVAFKLKIKWLIAFDSKVATPIFVPMYVLVIEMCSKYYGIDSKQMYQKIIDFKTK